MEQLSQVLSVALDEMKLIASIHDLEQLKSRYVGKQGLITAFMQKLKDLAHEERKAFGAQVNQVKTEFETALVVQRDAILAQELNNKLANGTPQPASTTTP